MTPAPHPTDEPEIVPEDDAVIGRALRRSMAVIGGVAVLVAGIVLMQRGSEAPEEVRDKDVGTIEDRVSDVQVLPPVRFSDVTEAAGIDFVHVNGARGEKLLPETMGGGAAFFDFDGDDDPDLLFVGGRPWSPSDGGEGPGGNRLYANDGGGHFTDVTAASGLGGDTYAMGVAVADYDGDGRVDVFTTGLGANRLYRNTPTGFEDATARAGVGGDPERWTTGAGFFDYDLDGDLDLFVCSYVLWSREIDELLAFTLNGVDRAYGPPLNYAGTFSTLYRNEGDGTFSDVSAEAGIQVANHSGEPMGKALGVTFADVDGDGYPEILVANDTVQNHLFHNQGDGTFAEVGAASGLGFDGNGAATGAMGIDAADYRGDGSLGVCIANFAGEMSSLYVASGSRLAFSDEAIGEGIGSPSRSRLSFGLLFFDYDLDGREDLLQVNGHLEEAINEVQPSQHYLQPPQLFWNGGPERRSCFVEVPTDSAGDLDLQLAGRGSAFADIDGDGDLDVVLVQVGARPVLLRNDQELNHRWLRIRLIGREGNRDAIGARIEAQVDGRALRRQVMPTRSYLSQSELPVTLGLGPEGRIESLEVIWTDGARQTVPVPGLDRTLTVHRDT